MLKEQYEKNQVLVILLVVIFVTMGTYYYYEFKEMKKTKKKFQKKRVANVCPDYWMNVSNTNEERKCKNTHKIGLCNIGDTDADAIKDFGIGPYIRAKDGDKAKCTWSKYCKSSWEGYDHLCADVN